MDKQVRHKDKLALIDFFAPWCGSCQTMDPLLENMEKRVEEEVSIVRIDVDENPQVAAIFNVHSVPTFILFRDGDILWRQSGIASPRKLEALIRKYSVD